MRASPNDWNHAVPTTIWSRLGKCNEYGFDLRDGPAAEEVSAFEDEAIIAVLTTLDEFTPKDADERTPPASNLLS